MQNGDLFWHNFDRERDPFFEVALSSGLLHYIVSKFMEDSYLLSDRAQQMLLCRILYSRTTELQHDYRVHEVFRSLGGSVNPNLEESDLISGLSDLLTETGVEGRTVQLRKNSKTPWQLFLCNLYESDKHHRDERAESLLLAKFLLKAGADLEATVAVSQAATLNAREIFEHYFEPEETKELLQLIQSFDNHHEPIIKVERAATVRISGKETQQNASQAPINWIASWSPFRSKTKLWTGS